MEYISSKQFSEKFSLSQRRVNLLCSQNRIEGAVKIGNYWAIPEKSIKPADQRIKNSIYKKQD